MYPSIGSYNIVVSKYRYLKQYFQPFAVKLLIRFYCIAIVHYAKQTCLLFSIQQLICRLREVHTMLLIKRYHSSVKRIAQIANASKPGETLQVQVNVNYDY